MGNIKEWFSDNLRYFILFIALIVVLVGVYFGVRKINNISKTPEQPEKQTEQIKETEASTEVNSDVIVSTENTGLVLNDAKVLTMMTSYYTAKTNKDIETLTKLDPTMNQAEEVENLENTNVEGYNNIKTYSKNGPEEGCCVVYVCYDGKVRDIETQVPSLVQYFLKTNSEGNYYIADITEDTAASEFVEESKKSAEVQDLIKQVNAACEEAKASDADLEEFMNKYGASNSKSEEPSETKKKQKNKKETEKKVWMIAIDSCNVRAEANTDCDIVGSLVYGDEVEVFENKDGWCRVLYEDAEAYVSADFLVSEEEFDAAEAPEEEEADYYDGSDYDYYDAYDSYDYYEEAQY